MVRGVVRRIHEPGSVDSTVGLLGYGGGSR